MNAKQAEAATGISRRNLRFYEQQGLICPRRNPDNDYREYSKKDIEDLKLIRTLRMLDVPLEEIDKCLKGKCTLAEIAEGQERRLTQRQKEVEMAIRFCKELGQENISIDGILKRMEEPETEHQLFTDWKKDYKLVEESESRKSFSFTPDEGITNAREFTNALCWYGQEYDKNIVITKEGMYPEFIMDGVEYTAERLYRNFSYVPVPVAVVHCTAKNPELLEPDLPKGKKKAMQIFRNWWFLLLILVPDVLICITSKANLWESLLIILSEAALVVACLWSYKSNHW